MADNLMTFGTLADLIAIIKDDEKYRVRLTELSNQEGRIQKTLDDIAAARKQNEELLAQTRTARDEQAALRNERKSQLEPLLQQTQSTATDQKQQMAWLQQEKRALVEAQAKHEEKIKRDLSALAGRDASLTKREAALDAREDDVKRREAAADAVRAALQPKAAAV